MKVQELLDALRDVDPESTLLFLAEHADADEADELVELHVPSRPWTHEVGRYDEAEYQVWYPYPPKPRDEGYEAVTFEPRRVVVLSTGPTNLTFIRPEDMRADFEPDERQRQLVKDAIEAHRRAQASGDYAPDRVVEKWSSEVGIETKGQPKLERQVVRRGRLRSTITRISVRLRRFFGC